MTDDVDRMHRYLEPYDKDLRKFLTDNKEKITILEADTLRDTKEAHQIAGNRIQILAS